MKRVSTLGVAVLCGMLVLLAAVSEPAAAQSDAAGRFIALTGDVRILGRDGVARVAVRNGEIREGESIVTGANSLAQLRLTDGGAVSVRADSQMKIDSYRFAGADDRNASFWVSIVKGGLRTITGLIGHSRRDNWRVTTPAATIGIRGTHFEVVHVQQALPAAPAGTYTRVFDGVVAFQNLKGVMLDVRREQTVFVPLAGIERPVLVAPPATLFGKPTPITTQPAPQSQQGEGTGGAASKSATAVREAPAAATGATTTIAPARVQSAPLLNPLDTPRVQDLAPARTTISPTLTSPATTTISPTLVAPTTTIQTSPTLTAPATTIISPTTTTISPTTTTISPTLTSPTLISPTTTTISPTTTTISPTLTSPTLISPTTTTISPTLTSPTLISPTTTTISPTTTIQTSPTLTSPTLTAPTTTIKR